MNASGSDDDSVLGDDSISSDDASGDDSASDDDSEPDDDSHDDHGRWENETLPALPGASKLYAVDFVDAQNGWAVGEVDLPERTYGLTLRRDANGWRQEDLLALTCGNFSAVDFVDAEHGWIACGVTIFTVGFQYDAGTWTPLDLGMWGLISQYDVAAINAGDAFFAGALSMEGGHGWLLEFDNGAWDTAIDGTTADWFGAATIRGNQGFASHCSWRGIYFPVRTYQYDGAGWTQEASPPALEGCLERFAVSPGGTWYAVGGAGLGFGDRANPILFSKTSSGWQSVEAPDSDSAMLHDTAVPADDLGFAVGVLTDAGNGSTGYALRFDGAAWTRIGRLSGAGETYHGVSYIASPRNS